jgi:hypothetical protein
MAAFYCRRGAWCAPLALALLVALVVVNAARLPPDAATIASVDKQEADNGIDWPHRHSKCEEVDFRKSSLKLIREMPFIGLFEDLKVGFGGGPSLGFLGRTRFRAAAAAAAAVGDDRPLLLPLSLCLCTHKRPPKTTTTPKQHNRARPSLRRAA